MKITNVELNNYEDFVFIYNNCQCNHTVISSATIFELDIVWESDTGNYYPEYWSDFMEVYTQVNKIIFDALDYLLENGSPRCKTNDERSDLKKYKNHYIAVEFINNEPERDVYGNGKKGRCLMVNIGEYLKLREFQKLDSKIPNKQIVDKKVKL